MALTHLSLKNCGIGNDLAFYLGQGLPSTRILQSLNLSQNKIGDRGATSIALGLMQRMQGGSLVHLHLGRNQIGDGGGYQLALLLRVNPQLTDLNHEYNNLTEESGTEFVTSMRSNTRMQRLNLRCNLISLKVIDEVERRGRENEAKFMHILGL